VCIVPYCEDAFDTGHIIILFLRNKKYVATSLISLLLATKFHASFHASPILFRLSSFFAAKGFDFGRFTGLASSG